MGKHKFTIRDSKTHERLGETDDATARFGRPNRDDVYIDAYPEDYSRKLDAWVEDQNRR